MRVLVREPIAEAGIELLRERFDVDVDANGDLAETIGGYDAIVIRSATQLDAALLEKADRLKVIGRAGVGVDNVDVEAATRRGIVVANAPESTVISAAEHTRRPPARALAEHPAGARGAQGGPLGAVALRRARARGQDARRARLRAHRPAGRAPARAGSRCPSSRTTRSSPRSGSASSASTGPRPWTRSSPSADFLTLHLPLTAETRGSIDAAAFAKMRDGVRIVNAARGELLDEDALLDALRSGKVAAAALDVFSAEPYSGPLLELDNVVVTPHLAASTEEAQDRAGVIVAEQVVAALEGALVTNAVNIPSVGAEDIEVLGPFIPLAASLGRLAMELASGRAERFEIAYYGALAGYDTRLLTVAALNGAFQGRADQPVNYVNAPGDRGRARSRGRRGAPPRLARLHEPRPRRGAHERRRAARGRARRSAATTAAGS